MIKEGKIYREQLKRLCCERALLYAYLGTEQMIQKGLVVYDGYFFKDTVSVSFAWYPYLTIFQREMAISLER